MEHIAFGGTRGQRTSLPRRQVPRTVMNRGDPPRPDRLGGQELVADRLRHRDHGAGAGQRALELPVERGPRLLANRPGQPSERQVVHRRHRRPARQPERRRQDEVRREEHRVTLQREHQRLYRAQCAQHAAAPAPRPGRRRTGDRLDRRPGRRLHQRSRSVRMGKERRAVESQAQSLRVGQMLQDLEEVPADAGQRLPERTDVDRDGQPAVRGRTGRRGGHPPQPVARRTDAPGGMPPARRHKHVPDSSRGPRRATETAHGAHD